MKKKASPPPTVKDDSHRSISDSTASWFLTNLLAATQCQKIAGPRYYPVQPIGHNDRALGRILDSEVAKGLYSLYRQLKVMATTLSPSGDSDYDRALEEMRAYDAVAFRFFRATLESELPAGTLQPGEHVEVRRRWALVAVKCDSARNPLPQGGQPKNPEAEEENPLTSILAIIQHLKVLQRVLGPGFQNNFRSLFGGMQ